jgi:hypothetical protein
MLAINHELLLCYQTPARALRELSVVWAVAETLCVIVPLL